MSRGPYLSRQPIGASSPILRVLFEVIERRGMQMEVVAHMMGAHAQQLWRWRAGKSIPRLDSVEKLADALGVDIDVFCPEDRT